MRTTFQRAKPKPKLKLPTLSSVVLLLPHLLQPMVSFALVTPSRLFRRTLLPRNTGYQPLSQVSLTSLTSKTISLMHATGTMETPIKTQQIPCPSAENEEKNYGLSHLQKRTQWLIANHTALGKVCLSIAGGGGHALSTLAATSGASQLLLEGTVTYDRASFQNYVKRALPNDKSFSYSSVEAATMSSESALLRGMQLRSRTTEKALWALRDTIGLGSTSTLKTTTQGGMSKSGRPSHGNVVATCSDGTQVGMQLILNCPTQNRFQQDVFVSHMILQTLEEIAKQKSAKHSNKKEIVVENDDGAENENGIVDPNEFGGLTIRLWKRPVSPSANDDDAHQQDCPVQSAAHRILSGEESAVLLLPKEDVTVTATTTTSMEGCNFLEPLRYPVLPDNCLIFPGSYNPPHAGHVCLARAAIAKVSSPTEPRPLVFEISITNADKPAMEPEEVARRVSQFRTVMKEATGIPQWGILLTSSPLFADKVDTLKQYAPPAVQTHPKFPLTEERNRWSFVIGADTMVRVLNPKYYNHDYDQMLAAQRSMGADFVVGGRLEGETQFVTGEEALEGLPQDVKDMFVILGESDFRVDISSTELRAAES